MKFKFLTALIVMTLSKGAFAAGMSDDATINKVGCHMNNATCYVYLDQTVGPDSCSSNSIRWSKDAENGQETLSLLTAAFFAGKKASFYVLDSCYEDGIYPTFGYFNVNNN
ncbi:hypothetical protein [Microbulbifer sp. VAAF005]|uniref:hypothetical protein n=1 Tax=Microbulbifer sp. VAAF005 TaxID=3034230 RepID=UPI0024AD5DDB|nr:hypothetical protein [Microbulbifer sp. VAAF005]WHI48008.1 hypothetical protein P0078_06390 [Microbulbifer sp. VAAF005]